MVFYIYKIKGINYIGSTQDIKRRCQKHKSSCWNENSKEYNLLTYQYIREKNIKIELEILGVYKRECSKRIRFLVEQYYINKYDSINNGLNTLNAFSNREKYIKEYGEKNKEKIKKRQKQYREKNKEKLKQKAKKYHKEHKEKRKEYEKKYRKENKEKVNERQKRWREQNREKYNEKSRKSYEKNKHKYSIKIKCPKCNSLIRKDCLKKHQKSKKCKTMALKCTDVFVCEI